MVVAQRRGHRYNTYKILSTVTININNYVVTNNMVTLARSLVLNFTPWHSG